MRSTRSGSLSVSSFCTHRCGPGIQAPLLVPARTIIGIASARACLPATSVCDQPSSRRARTGTPKAGFVGKDDVVVAILVDVDESQPGVAAFGVDDRVPLGSENGSSLQPRGRGRSAKMACCAGLPTISSQMPSRSRSRKRTPWSRPARAVAIGLPASSRPAASVVSAFHCCPSKCQAPVSSFVAHEDARDSRRRAARRSARRYRRGRVVARSVRSGKSPTVHLPACRRPEPRLAERFVADHDVEIAIVVRDPTAARRCPRRRPRRSDWPASRFLFSRSCASRKLRNLTFLPCFVTAWSISSTICSLRIQLCG